MLARVGIRDSDFELLLSFVIRHSSFVMPICTLLRSMLRTLPRPLPPYIFM